MVIGKYYGGTLEEYKEAINEAIVNKVEKEPEFIDALFLFAPRKGKTLIGYVKMTKNHGKDPKNLAVFLVFNNNNLVVVLEEWGSIY